MSNELTFQDLDPAELVVGLEVTRRQLKAANQKRSRLVRERAEVRREFTLVFDSHVLAVVDAAAKAGERAPAEDIRKARARAAMEKENPDLVRLMTSLDTEIEALDLWIKGVRDDIGASQTVINNVRELT